MTTMRVKMRDAKRNESGLGVLQRYGSYRVSRAYGEQLVQQGAAIDIDRALLDTRPRVFVLTDSVGHRQFYTVNASSPVKSGTDVAMSSASQAIPVGSLARMVNVAALRDYRVPVVASDASGFTLRYPFDLSSVTIASPNVYLESKLNDTGWLNLAFAALAEQGKPVNLYHSAAVGGALVADMRARFTSEILPLGPRAGDILIFAPSINDIEVTATAAVIEDLEWLYARALALGMIVHTGVITQAGLSSYFTTPATALAQIEEINRYVITRAAGEPKMRVFRGDLALGGGSYATAGLTEVSGGPHPTPLGAAAIGARYVADCGDDYAEWPIYRFAADRDNYVSLASVNRLTNCQFAGASGTGAGTGWTATGTSNTFSNPNGRLRLVKAAGGANLTTVSQVVTDRLFPGEEVVFGFAQETITPGVGHYIRGELVFTVGGVEQAYTIGRNQFSVGDGGVLPPAGTRRLHRMAALVPEGFTAAVLRWSIQQGAVGSMEIELGEPILC